MTTTSRSGKMEMGRGWESGWRGFRDGVVETILDGWFLFVIRGR